MPFAAEDKISQDDFEDALEISEEQYAEGLSALLSGRHVTIVGGFGTYDPVVEVPEVLEPTTEQLAQNAMDKRDDILATAAIRIAPLQDAVDLDDATASEVNLLKKWKQYRIAVNRIDQQEGYPLYIQWPVEPST